MQPLEPGGELISRLYVAAKPPRPLVAKTRLGASIGHDRAAALYRGFLRDLADRFLGFRHEVGWFVPPRSWSEILAVIGPGWRLAPVVFQRGSDWTERQRRLFLSAGARAEERLVLIASDSPQLRRRVVEEAFSRLDRADVVMGPVRDGGYYLLGVRGAHDVLDGVQMGTAGVGRAIRQRCDQLRLRLSLLEPTFDIDELEDLDRLRPLASRRPDLASTRAALP